MAGEIYIADKASLDTLKSTVNGMLSTMQKFDFDNLINLAGNTYKAEKTSTSPVTWTETVRNSGTQEVFATRVSTKTDSGWVVATACPSLTIDTTITYTKTNGVWEGVIS